ncbi:uncharacterized protein LOC121308362 [Polyodon spathula]|uniref:uncharacterized protein LOC121308362 n=1 Tax=Polyodon spathula TaxID=7913 RepID=UPI001B7EB3AB|nr:uncharacterized protein LOC121308362 [Polyodon spathula]XP_041096654.1 uncharacterized protein LOC121308362 [Polyodon spathula]
MKLPCLLLVCCVWSGVVPLSIAQKFVSKWISEKEHRSTSSGYEETWQRDSGSFARSNNETKAKKRVVLPEAGIPFYVTPFPHKMLSPRESDGDTHATLPPEIKRIMSLGSVDKSPTTPAVSDVAVLCGESHMVVKVKKRFFGFGCTASQLSLGYNYECQSNGVDRKTGDIVFTYSQSACGSKRSMPDGLVVYQNILRYVPNRRRSSIRRTHPLNIEIECRYPRFHHLYKLVFRPTWNPPAGIRTLKQSGFDLIPMNSAWTKGSLSNVYQLGQVINFQARGYPRKPGQKIFVHSCHATASPDSNSTPQYNVIDNYGCMVDSKIEASNSSFVPPRTRDTINFVVDAFQFNVKPSSKIYLHCILFLANSPQVTPGAKSCTYNRIKKRWEELEGFNSVCTCCNSKCVGGALESLSEDLKSSGPLLFVGNEVEDPLTEKQSSFSQSSPLLDDSETVSSSSSDPDDQITWVNAVETAENMTDHALAEEQGKSSHIDTERREVEMYREAHSVPANKPGAPEEPSEEAADHSEWDDQEDADWDEYDEEVPQGEKYKGVLQSEHHETGQWENFNRDFDVAVAQPEGDLDAATVQIERTRGPGWVKGSGTGQSEGAAPSEEAEQHEWLVTEGTEQGARADERVWDYAEGTESDEDYHDTMDDADLQSDSVDPMEWSEQRDLHDWDGYEGYSPSGWDEGEGLEQSKGGLENGSADENQSNVTILPEEIQSNRTSLPEAHTEGDNYSEWGASAGAVQDAERAGGFGVPPGHTMAEHDAPDQLKARMRKNPAQGTWGKMQPDY